MNCKVTNDGKKNKEKLLHKKHIYNYMYKSEKQLYTHS